MSFENSADSATSRTSSAQGQCFCFEPAGPGQNLPAAGILAACVASLAPDPPWLRAYLTRTLHAFSLPPGARDGLIQQALEIASSHNAVPRASEVADAYLRASSFGQSQAIPLISAVLEADVINCTVYDARARESVMRYISALNLPPRILYTAEHQLAELVIALAENSTVNGENVESVGEDEAHTRRRTNMKWLKVGAAGLFGGLALGISGGLIAPALLPALGTVGLASATGPLAALGGGGAVAVGSLFGAAGAGVGAAAMKSRTGDIDEFSFEPCTPSHDSSSHAYDTARITPTENIHEAYIQLSMETRAIGGLLVWEILTSQQFDMVVPARIAFGVQTQDLAHGAARPVSKWLLSEQFMDVGGLDRNGKGKRRRTTGAVTITENKMYVLRFRLMPGSLTVNISYRTAFVPPGIEPPVWIMGENEEHATEHEKSKPRSLSMAILVPGLLSAAENSAYPGMCADQFHKTTPVLAKFGIQTFALRWESQLLLELSNALRKLIARMTVSIAAQNGAMMVLPALVGAVALPVSIIGALRTLIGNIWAKAISHAAECGYMLAAELASRSFGNRPIVLAGFSVGALVVFSCLQELARRKLDGIVHDAYLIGAPCTADLAAWREVRSVVSGRLVNAYNPRDWYLELYHRGTNLGSVAGNRPVKDVEGIANVENVCLTQEQVANHMDYAKRSQQILVDLGIANPEVRRPWSMDLAVSTQIHEPTHNAEHSSDIFESETGASHSEELDVVLFKSKRRAKPDRRKYQNSDE
ncbi:unnamed protein product [Agarophyton chilense]|eukprot:gb/GEZJ01001235.1/.p1 GENE.gb/GEZJ01001235.1/~~gb/GEZJ01001235.1/.p1  ORF type:complete len:762 (-),score=102.63 gb/GEZJ01001235.1/:168-2453(-)